MMTQEEQDEAMTRADLEIKYQQAELIKAQARRDNAEAARLEAQNKAKQ